MVRISVVVPARNEEKMVGRCLNAIASQKFRSYELIVVDGHSKDGTAKISRKYADKVLLDKKRGVGAARNLGSVHANGDILAFTDADTIVCKDWLKTIDENFGRERRLVGLAGPVSALDGSKKDKTAMRMYSKLVESTSDLVPFFGGSNCAYQRSVFMKAGGFREDLSIFDDFELSMRMKKFGRTKFDRQLLALTSLRRLKQHGYANYILKYMSAGMKVFFGRSVGKEYFADIDK